MEALVLFDTLKGKFGDAVVELQGEGCTPAFVVVAPASVKEIARFGGDVSAMVPTGVAARLRASGEESPPL